MSEVYTRDKCISLLQAMQLKLQQSGEERLPKRLDFANEEVVAIKAFLGPWPRALEAAELKPVRDDGKKQRAIEKRIRAKRRRTEALKIKNNREIKENEKQP